MSLLFLFGLYAIAVEPDRGKRRMTRVAFELRQYRKLAEQFGMLAIDAELELNKLVESARL